MVLETIHLPDKGDQDNVLGMDKADYAKVIKHKANIVGDKCPMIKEINPVRKSSN